MNFPKRLLLLFLSVHAFPTDHTSVYTAPLCLQSPHGPMWLQVCWGHVSIKSSKGPFVVSMSQGTGLSKCDSGVRRTSWQ